MELLRAHLQDADGPGEECVVWHLTPNGLLLSWSLVILDLLSHQIVVLEGRSQTRPNLVFVLDFQKCTVANLAHEVERTFKDPLAVDDNFLSLYFDGILIFGRELAHFLFEELPQEEYASVHVYRANEGYQLEEKETCLEWEQEGATPENLRQSLRDRTTDQVVGILNVFQNV